MQEVLNRYKICFFILIGLFIILSVQKCSNKELEVLKKQYLAQKEQVRIIESKRTKEKDSLIRENTKLAENTKYSENKVLQLEDKVKNLKQQTQLQKEKLKNLSYEALAEEFNNQFSTEDAQATINSVELKKDLPNRVLEAVYDANECQEIVSIKDQQLKEKDSQISNTKKKLNNSSIMLDSAEKEITERKKLQELGEENIKNLESQNKKLKTKNFINTYILPPLLTFGGILIGKSL